ncbi:plastid lipid-associated PAP/fibrillin family protein [Nitzschia inconspicua]|uniref:Plastid lipid-associated PAP/fibrillin family protein n=1 Tax=Nitzschia inconspicua TaxID=303405 RepID=A0A9K3LNQ9_9STRA|nr:plastid lipid-associated PAP/fibrillin family protein [Nitzschia inconspicua]
MLKFALLQVLFLAAAATSVVVVEGFFAVAPTNSPKRRFGIASKIQATSADIFLTEAEVAARAAAAADDYDDDLSTVDVMEIKRRLLDLVPRMMGTDEEYRQVEAYVNTLEERFTPVQTLQFFNMATAGEWQLLFSTNLSGMPKPNTFRLRELLQRVEANNFNGTICNEATWDLSQDENGIFDASGTFAVKCSYTINQGARMVVDLDDHVLELAKGSAVPKDVQGLVGLLHRAIPKELFDPNDHAMDTTYLDGDLRIVRMTGPRLEGVRDIFIRRGSMEINPV